MTNPFDRAPEAPENVLRGFLFSLIVVPVGVVAWVLIWELGFVASVVAFGIAAATVWLYRRGSGGKVSPRGAIAIVAVVIGTLLLAFYSGLVWDYVLAVGKQVGLSPVDALTNPAFWPSFNADFGSIVSANGTGLLFAFGFGAIGVFSTLRRVLRAAKVPAEAPLIMPPSGHAQTDTAQASPEELPKQD